MLPIPSNNKMNAYLKEIAAICNIDKTLTTHVARHTFARLAIGREMQKIGEVFAATN